MSSRRARRIHLTLVLAFAVACGPALALVFTVTEPWVRPAVAGATTEAFVTLASSEETTLIDVRSPIAASLELVSAKRRQSPPLALRMPARTEVTLEPGGTRIALVGITRTLKLGERVPITLVLRHADGTIQDIEVNAEVRKRSPRDDHRH